jgi:hypothetical protein
MITYLLLVNLPVICHLKILPKRNPSQYGINPPELPVNLAKHYSLLEICPAW